MFSNVVPAGRQETNFTVRSNIEGKKRYGTDRISAHAADAARVGVWSARTRRRAPRLGIDASRTRPTVSGVRAGKRTALGCKQTPANVERSQEIFRVFFFNVLPLLAVPRPPVARARPIAFRFSRHGPVFVLDFTFGARAAKEKREK